MLRIILSTLLFISLPWAAYLIWYSVKRRTMPGAVYFIIILSTIILYNGAYLGEINANTESVALFWYYVEHLAIPLQPGAWLLMCLDYTQKLKKLPKIGKAIIFLQILFYYIIFFSNGWHHQYISRYIYKSNGFFSVLITEKGWLYMIVIFTIGIFALLSSGLYLDGFRKATKLHRRGYLTMIAASLFPLYGVYINTASNNYLGIDYFPFLIIVSGILYTFGIFQYNIFNTIPIATEIVYRQSKEGIALFDITGRLLDANERCISLFPELKHLLNKVKLSAFCISHQELRELSEENPRVEYSRLSEDVRRYYQAEINMIKTEDGIGIGRILSISDITLYKEHQKQLENMAASALEQAETNELSFLQAQIKPHFINNTLSIISSMITRDPKAAKDVVLYLSEYLLSCYQIDNSSPFILLDKELEGVYAYVNIERFRFRERMQFLDSKEDVPNLQIPRFILQPLIENAIRHGVLVKMEGGTVTLHITRQDNKIRFEITDDGVGIEESRIQKILTGTDELQGIAVYNIHRRLIKHYGEGLSITSIVGKGTSVAFSVPYNEQVEK